MDGATSYFDRRIFLAAGTAMLAAGRANAEGILTLTAMIDHPALKKLYGIPGGTFDAEMNAGLNRGGFRTIEEQRQGAEWIINGSVSGKAEWITLGWRILDRGLVYQQANGGFGRWGGFHSTSLYVESLARAMLIDPAGASQSRLNRLARSAAWLEANTQLGLQENGPYTHRRYILMAGLGQAAAVTGQSARGAIAWANMGLALQRSDGVNPEAGGYDASYQMVGVLHTMRYLPVCPSANLAAKLRRMARRAVGWELRRMQNDGHISTGASTRTGHEMFADRIKTINYPEIFQALVYGSQLVDPNWLEPAQRIGALKGLI